MHDRNVHAVLLEHDTLLGYAQEWDGDGEHVRETAAALHAEPGVVWVHGQSECNDDVVLKHDDVLLDALTHWWGWPYWGDVYRSSK